MTAQVIPHAARRTRRASRTDHHGGPRLLPLVFFTFLVVAVFFSMIYLRIALDRSAFELDTITDQIAVEESLQLDLRLELAQLQDPQRIASQAEQIGLVYPDERVAIVVDSLSSGPGPGPVDDSVPVRALDGVTP